MRTARRICTAAAVTAVSTAFMGTGAPHALAQGVISSSAPMVTSAPQAMTQRVVSRTGSCSGPADWTLTVEPDDGRLEVEFEVDHAQSGQTWRVRVRDNGDLVLAYSATTRGADGTFSVSRPIANRAGTDNLVARARNLSTGQRCVGRLSY